MYYVYIIKSVKYPRQIYIGSTKDVESRIKYHNNGHVPHTSKFRPWKIKFYITFDSKRKALLYEKYLKSGSGRQYIHKHFL